MSISTRRKMSNNQIQKYYLQRSLYVGVGVYSGVLISQLSQALRPQSFHQLLYGFPRAAVFGSGLTAAVFASGIVSYLGKPGDGDEFQRFINRSLVETNAIISGVTSGTVAMFSARALNGDLNKNVMKAMMMHKPNGLHKFALAASASTFVLSNLYHKFKLFTLKPPAKVATVNEEQNTSTGLSKTP